MADTPTTAAPPKTRKLRKQEAAEGLSPTDVLAAKDPRLVDAAVKAGPLQKRSEQGLLHNWKKRHVVLTEALLYYFESEASAKPQGELARAGDWSGRERAALRAHGHGA
jgi:hypothetical protein